MGPAQNVSARGTQAAEDAEAVALVDLDAHAAAAGVGRQQPGEHSRAVVRRAVIDEDDFRAFARAEGLAALEQERQIGCLVIAGDDQAEFQFSTSEITKTPPPIP